MEGENDVVEKVEGVRAVGGVRVVEGDTEAVGGVRVVGGDTEAVGDDLEVLVEVELEEVVWLLKLRL